MPDPAGVGRAVASSAAKAEEIAVRNSELALLEWTPRFNRFGLDNTFSFYSFGFTPFSSRHPSSSGHTFYCGKCSTYSHSLQALKMENEKLHRELLEFHKEFKDVQKLQSSLIHSHSLNHPSIQFISLFTFLALFLSLSFSSLFSSLLSLSHFHSLLCFFAHQPDSSCFSSPLSRSDSGPRGDHPNVGGQAPPLGVTNTVTGREPGIVSTRTLWKRISNKLILLYLRMMLFVYNTR